MCFSFICEKTPVELFSSCVCVFIFKVPSIQRCMFIFLGSLTPSVQNKSPSITFIPVTIVSSVNFKTLLALGGEILSTNTGVILAPFHESM